MEENNCCCCSGKKKDRSEKEYKDLVNRLSRIEGQIRGIKRMLDEDCYCPDIRDKYKVTVATNDALEQQTVMSLGALRMSARELRDLIERTNREGLDNYS